MRSDLGLYFTSQTCKYSFLFQTTLNIYCQLSPNNQTNRQRKRAFMKSAPRLQSGPRHVVVGVEFQKSALRNMHGHAITAHLRRL